MIRVAVCDDDPKQLHKINDIIFKAFSVYTDDYKICSFENGKTLLEKNSEEQFDVLFLDIDMPEVSGFDIAMKLRADFSSCFIIFITSYSELVYRSFDFQPFHFVQKNSSVIMENDINDVVARLMMYMKQNQKIVIDDPEYGRHAFYYRNIIYIKSEGHYLLYHLQKMDKPLRTPGKLNDISDEYEKFDFTRVHRSIIVNLRYLDSIDFKIGKLYVSNDSEKIRIPVGSKYAKNLDQKFTEYLRSTI